MGETLDGLLGSMDRGGRLRESMALAYWRRVVGDQAAAASRAESVRDGVLVVRTRSSAWSHELSLLKHHIMGDLNRRLGRPAIRDIVFRAQGVAPDPIAEEDPNPTDDDLAAVKLPPKVATKLRRELEALVAITDDLIRESTARQMVRSARLNQWRLDHGWRTCGRCRAPHARAGSLCPLCRLSR